MRTTQLLATVVLALSLGGQARSDLAGWSAAVASGTPPTWTGTNIAIPVQQDIGAIGAVGGATYEFVVNGTDAGLSSALMGLKGAAGNPGTESALKFEQFADTGSYGVTQWGVIDVTIAPHTVNVDQHVVFVSDIVANTCELFIDGVSVGLGNHAPHLAGTVGIGEWYDPTGFTVDPLTGDMLGVATYDSMLTPSEIAAHAAAFHDSNLGTNFCVATTNSTGAPAAIVGTGSLVVADNALTLAAGPVPNQPGLFFYGPTATQIPFGNGFRCIGSQGTVGIQRMPVENAASGVLTHNADLTQSSTPQGLITPGTTWYFQAWYRDPAAGGASFNLSDGLELSF